MKNCYCIFTKHCITYIVYNVKIKLIFEVHNKKEAHWKPATINKWNQKNLRTTKPPYYRKPEIENYTIIAYQL